MVNKKRGGFRERRHMNNTSTRLLLLFYISLVGLACSSCKMSAHVKTHNYSGTNGVDYFYAIVTFNRMQIPFESNSPPIIVISRSSVGEMGSSINWECSEGEMYIDGMRLKPVQLPTLYYKKAGVLRRVQINNSGVWSCLFSTNAPSAADLENIINICLEKN